MEVEGQDSSRIKDGAGPTGWPTLRRALVLAPEAPAAPHGAAPAEARGKKNRLICAKNAPWAMRRHKTGTLSGWH